MTSLMGGDMVNVEKTKAEEKLARIEMLLEKKTVIFDGARIEVKIPTGQLADYMFNHGKPSHA